MRGTQLDDVFDNIKEHTGAGPKQPKTIGCNGSRAWQRMAAPFQRSDQKPNFRTMQPASISIQSNYVIDGVLLLGWVCCHVVCGGTPSPDELGAAKPAPPFATLYCPRRDKAKAKRRPGEQRCDPEGHSAVQLRLVEAAGPCQRCATCHGEVARL